MEGIVLDFFDFDVLDELISMASRVFVVEQACLLNRDDLICEGVHNEYPACHASDEVNIGEMVLLELDISLVFIVEHAGERPNGTLQHYCLQSMLCCAYSYRVAAEAEPPKDYFI